MTTEKKYNISVIVAIIGSTIAVGTLIYNFGGSQKESEITSTNQTEMDKTLKSINENVIWTKTTLINHIAEDDKREKVAMEKDEELKDIIIDQNAKILKALEK
ncbi:MAG: hypothetical protein IT212_07530 [Bacteroidia bacterium]|nr:hypothetical protein [Bacteroidia bacterium]